MKFPTKYTHYGHGWLDKISQGFHPGIDYNNGGPSEDEGQDVVAITDGIVVYAKSNSGWGWHVIIHHPKYNVYSHYAHLQSFCVREDQKLKEGDLVGFLGGTGGNWKPHLHFEIRIKKIPANKYVTGMTLGEIKNTYANPETWIQERINEKKVPDIIDVNIIKNNNFMKLIKNTTSKKVYALGHDNKKHWIFNEETFKIGNEMKLWGGGNKIVEQNDDGYEEGHTILLVR